MDTDNKNPPSDPNVVSAQVVLKSASGKKMTPDAVITSETVADYMPSAEAITSATKAFKKAGFKVGTLVGNNFSITARRELFEKIFKAQITVNPDGGVEVLNINKRDDAARKGANKQQLPVKNVTPALRANVESIVFAPPPDFGD